MNLLPNDIHIWRYTTNENDYVQEKTSPLLSNLEQKRCNEYLNESERIRYTCNHRFVRQVLGKYLDIPPSQIEFSLADRGKPYIKNVNLFFSYSYRAGHGLLALSGNTEVGVDIEKIKILHDPPTFMSFSFSENEREIILNSRPDNFQDTLFTFWTFKEAIIKALGVGLNADLTKIDLSAFFYRDNNPLGFDFDNNYTIKRLVTREGYKAAFAVKGNISSCLEYDFSDF